jgi:hypothetical protein
MIKDFINKEIKTIHATPFSKRFKDKYFEVSGENIDYELRLVKSGGWATIDGFYIHFNSYDKKTNKAIEAQSILLIEDYFTVLKIWQKTKKHIKNNINNN